MNELDLFTEALARTDPAERASYLDKACAGNPELRRRLDELLLGHAHSSSPLDRSPVEQRDIAANTDQRAPLATGAFDPSAQPFANTATAITGGPPSPSKPATELTAGTVIADRYTLVEVIGEGGMGSVYLANQSEPVKRQVALKLIKTGMDSKAVLARFDAERQALAMMDHPNIARIYDGGVTPAGQPFFVMELVQGIPLTEYCDSHRLSVDARLELFVQVCQAVQHAHQKGIIHRDLKPGNVLVTEVDGKPIPKVIDFGVAKATEQKLTEMSFSDVGAIVGTPAYMSPEQADPSSMDIDTRTDVYALGVMLYELLTGSPPIDASKFKRGAILEMLRMVREVEPPRPSTRLSTADALPNIAASRSIEPAKLSKLLQGELDWVVMKALEKDRTRRYETANGLAADVQRYLADEVVDARPPSTGYRLKKFVKRNKGQVIAASVVLVALLVGITGTTIGLFEARRQEAEAKRQEGIAREQEAEAKKQEAEAFKQAGLAREEARAKEMARADEERQRGVAEAEKKKADEEKRIAQAVKEFLQIKLLSQSDTTFQENALLRGGGSAAGATFNPTVRELLDRAARELAPDKIEESFPKQPLVQAEILLTVGTTYARIFNHLAAIDFLKRAESLYRQHGGPNHPGTFICMHNLAGAYQHAGKWDLALPLYEETLRLQKTKHGPVHDFTLTSMNNLGLAYKEAGKLDRALPLLEETLKLRKAQIGPEHPHTLASMNNLALAYQAAGKLDLALPLFEETLKLTKAKLGPEHTNTLYTVSGLALAHLDAGRPDLALPYLEETLKLLKSKRGPDDHATLSAMNNLAGVYQEVGKLDLALSLYEETLKLEKSKLGPDHPSTLTSMHNLAGAYQAAGKWDLALPLFEETLKLRKAKLGLDHPSTLNSMDQIAQAYRDAGKRDLALPLFEETLKLRKAKLGLDHRSTLTSMNNLALAYEDAGKRDLALPLLEETLKIQKVKLGPDHPETTRSMHNLAGMYREERRLDLALPLFEETLKLRKARHGPDHPETLITMNNLAQAYLAAGKLDLALPLFEETLKVQKAKQGHDHPDTLITMGSLAYAYQEAGKLDLALPLCQETLKLSKAKLGPDHPHTLAYMNNLALAYQKDGKPDLALPLCEETLKLTKAKLGPEHPHTLGSMNNLARAYQAAGKLDLALPLLEETLNLRKARLGPEHPQTLASKGNLGKGYADANQGEKAAAMFKEFVAGNRKGGKSDSPQFAGVLSMVSLELLNCGQHATAEEFLRECLAIREKTQPDAWTTFNTQSMLGGALLGQKKYADAEPLLLKGYEGMKAHAKTIPPQASARIPEALDRLIELSTAMKKPDDVKKWQAERAKYAKVAPAPGAVK